MNDRATRLEAIRRIISTERLASQEDLKRRLDDEGITVTQATLSRDLKYIQVVKVSDGEGGYHYSLQENVTDYANDLLRGWLSIEFSGNIGVVRTLPGHANSVAIAVDAFEFDELLGTVAGDDTIILVLREAASAADFRLSLVDAVPGIQDKGEER